MKFQTSVHNINKNNNIARYRFQSVSFYFIRFYSVNVKHAFISYGVCHFASRIART